MSRKCFLSAFVFLAMSLAMTLSAQETGSIQGRITDPQQAAVPGVRVGIEQGGTGMTRSTLSNSEGLYYFPSLVVGTYVVTAEAQGFKKVVTPNVRVEVGQRVQQDLTLEIGVVSE